MGNQQKQLYRQTVQEEKPLLSKYSNNISDPQDFRNQWFQAVPKANLKELLPTMKSLHDFHSKLVQRLEEKT